MDAPRFDTLARLLGTVPSRRSLLPLLGGALAFPALGILPASAKKKKKKGKKSTLCLDGQTVQASKKKKKKLLKSGATPGACVPPPPGCTPTCAGNTCGGDDGCGGICGCAAGSLCYSGVCHACDVRCTGNGTACGSELQTVLTGAGGGAVYACPGRYVGSFTIGNGSLVGAGQGDDPATSTILDAQQTGRVVDVSAGVSAALSGLRITGGGGPGVTLGGGIRNRGALTLTACTIVGNDANDGGGIYHGAVATSPLTLNACTVSGNTVAGSGGGIASDPGATTSILGSAITGNKAKFGGGLLNQGPLTFDATSQVTGNTASEASGGGGIYNGGGIVVTLNGATISGNTPNNCVNVPGCIG